MLKPALSVVIPTFNRAWVLRQTLLALEAARGEAPPFEVIVVDDGSTDATAELLEAMAAEAGDWLQPLHQDNRGPAAARNRGTQAATAAVVLYLGDDTIPARGLFAAHHEHHRRGDPVAVLGYTPYHPQLGEDRFLFYLEQMGHQFGYGLIEEPDDLPFNFAYSSNLSLPRALLGEQPFREGIRSAAWEDVELGWRLQRAGVRLLLEPRAVAYHLHPVSLLEFCQRQEMVGASSLDALEQNPGLREFFGDGEPSERILRAERPLRLAARLLDPLLRLGLPLYLPRLFRAILDLHYHRGLRRAWNERHGLVVSEAQRKRNSMSPTHRSVGRL